MRNQVAVIALLVLVAPIRTVADSSSPASVLCDRGGGATRSETVGNLIAFHNALKGDEEHFKLVEKDRECVDARLSSVEADVAKYCEARSKEGHDLVFDPLRDLELALGDVYFECSRIRREAVIALFQKLAPKNCDELGSAYHALVELLVSEQDLDPENARCLDANIDETAVPLEKMCHRGELSLGPAYSELIARLEKLCKPSE